MKKASFAVCLVIVFHLVEHGASIDGCPEYHFGPDCNSKCNCKSDEQCNMDTGQCSTGCHWGYFGKNCSIPLARLTVKPTSSWQSSTAMTVSFKQWDNTMAGVGPVEEYKLQYRPDDNKEWTDIYDIAHTGNGEITEVTIIKLEPDTWYTFSLSCVVHPNIYGVPGPEGRAKTNLNNSSSAGELVPAQESQIFKLTVGILAGVLGISVIAHVVVALYCSRKQSKRGRRNNMDSAEKQGSAFEAFPPGTPGSMHAYEHPSYDSNTYLQAVN